MTRDLPAIHLQPFDQGDFDAWRAEAIPAYAFDHVRSGNWSMAECLARSQEAFDSLLPGGLETPGHTFSSIVANASAGAATMDPRSRVGVRWWAETEAAGRRGAFVYDIEIFEHARRRGYAQAALGELERIARERGIASVGLHVFGHNAGARRLYDEIGFVPTSVSMRKDLA
jgi:GNAT superfamily N-acetyltransferase